LAVSKSTKEGFSMASVPHSCPGRSFSFADAVSAFVSQPGLPFANVLSEEWIEGVFRKHDNIFGRVYTTSMVLWAFLSQVLRDGKEASCRSAVGRIASQWLLRSGRQLDTDTRDYCRARAKLSEAALRELSCAIATKAEETAEAQWLWLGQHVKLIDGSTFLMPDTASNQAAYPQNPRQKPGLGFPIARMVVVISLATACVIDATIGRYKGKETGETALLRQLLSCFQPGDVAVADRFYGNYWMIALLLQAGVNVCFRNHQLRKTDFRKGKRLGKHDHLIAWSKPKRPSWMSQHLYDSLPEKLQLRELKYVVVEPGRKHDPFVIITSLTETTGEQCVSADDIAELFSFRWNVELDIRSIKTHMNLHHLRCKSPEMVRREFWATMIAYNLIRTTAACAAALHDCIPRQISFVGACQYVLAVWDVLALATWERLRLDEYWNLRFEQIAAQTVADRPGRFEPRVIKKRKKNYHLMSQPRDILKQKLRKGDNSFEQR
jgi:hypothetical protein